MEVTSSLRRNVFSGVGVTAVSAALMMASYPVFLAYLGYELYGAWLVLATVIIFGSLGNLGIGSALTKLVAEEWARGNVTLVRQYVATATGILCVVAASLILSALFLRHEIVRLIGAPDEQRAHLATLLPYVAAVSAYTIISQIPLGVLAGLGRIDLVNYANLGGRLLSFTVSIVALAFGGSIESLLLGAFASVMFIHLAAIIATKRIVGSSLVELPRFSRPALKTLVRFGSAVFGGSLLNMALSPLHKILISRFVGVSAVPLYEIAFTGAMQVRALFEVGLRALMPEASKVAAGAAQHTRARLQRLMSRSLVLVFAVGLPTYLLLFAAADALLRLWLGARFLPSLVPSFRLMLVVSFVSLLAVPAYHLLMGLGAVAKCLIGHFLQTLISLAVIGLVITITDTLSVDLVLTSLLVGFSAATVYLVHGYRVTVDGMSLRPTAQSPRERGGM